MKKRLALLLAAVFCVAAITGCGGTKTETKANDADGTVKLSVAASPTPHAEILTEAKALLAEKGIELEIIEFTDYVQPNLVVDAGDIDANYFQHTPYLDSFNEEQGTKLVSAGAIVPNDTTNEARALMLLEVNGIIKLKEGAGLKATKADIEEYLFDVEIVEMEAAQVAKSAADADFVVVNGNYALLADFSIADALAIEEADSEAAKTYANIVAVREGDETRAEIQTLIEVLKGLEIKSYMEATYEGAVLPTE